MKLIAIASTLLCVSTLAGCMGVKTGADGVFEPTAIQPPPSQRDGSDKPVQPAERPADGGAPRRALSIPNR